MKRITKGPAPNCIARGGIRQTWDQFMGSPCHIEVGIALRREQNNVCCYCEVSLHNGAWHIEHLIPRDRDGGQTYKYSNLAASCDGHGGENLHCGHFKGRDYDALSFANMHTGSSANLFSYSIEGNISPKDDLEGAQEAKANYMIGLLNLKCTALNGHRRSHARVLIDSLGDDPTDEMLDWARKYYLQPDENGNLQSFYSLSAALLT